LVEELADSLSLIKRSNKACVMALHERKNKIKKSIPAQLIAAYS